MYQSGAIRIVYLNNASVSTTDAWEEFIKFMSIYVEIVVIERNN